MSDAKTTAVSYEAIANKLQQDLTLSLYLSEGTDLSQFKKRLSQAKFRAGIKGRISYTDEWQQAKKAWKVNIVLHPTTTKTVDIVGVDQFGGL